MIKQRLLDYAKTHWERYKTTVSDCSKSDGNKPPLVQSSEEVYDFDEICRALFPRSSPPSSADGIFVHPKSIALIEFKSGFKKTITKENFDASKARCKWIDGVCDDYWQLFFKHQKTETSQLIDSIRLKAIESYLTLEKHILPQCQSEGSPTLLKYVVVVDGDAVDTMEDTLAGLAGREEVEDNHISRIRQALSRLKNKRDANGDTYYYDRIEVMSAEEYSSRLRLSP